MTASLTPLLHVPSVRTVAPVVAGAARMPRRTLTVFNVVGAALWAVAFLVAGYFVGDVPMVARHVELIAVGVVALSFTPAAIAVARHRRRAHRQAVVSGIAVDVAEALG